MGLLTELNSVEPSLGTACRAATRFTNSDAGESGLDIPDSEMAAWGRIVWSLGRTMTLVSDASLGNTSRVSPRKTSSGASPGSHLARPTSASRFRSADGGSSSTLSRSSTMSFSQVSPTPNVGCVMAGVQEALCPHDPWEAALADNAALAPSWDVSGLAAASRLGVGDDDSGLTDP